MEDSTGAGLHDFGERKHLKNEQTNYMHTVNSICTECETKNQIVNCIESFIMTAIPYLKSFIIRF